jgi:putative hydroxymethylpyrimidine transport system substrate-binding protein
MNLCSQYKATSFSLLLFILRKIMEKSGYILAFLLNLLTLIATAATPQQNVTVVLDWFINPNHAPLFVAKEYGFF